MITDSEIIELERLLKEQEEFDFKKHLTRIDENTSPNYKALYNAINTQEWGRDEDNKPSLINGYAGFVLEGSSRSSKTWSGVDIIIYLATVKHKDKGCSINIYRETYNEFKTTLYDDFKRRLDDYGIDNPFHRAKEVASFKIGKSKISFLGDGKHGGGCDYAFFNEAMMIDQSIFDQVEMRCRKFWWMDYNPSFTEHWVFNSVLKRNDVGFLRTTFKDNPHISATELNKILSYEPWQPGSYEVTPDGELLYNGEEITEKHQPPPNLDNVDQGTADEFMWKVYGLGLRGAMKGQIFKHVTYIDKFPEHLEQAATYGNDFGFVNDPNALVKYAEEGMNIYVEPLLYTPIDESRLLDEAFKALGISKYVPITADSSDKYTSETKGTVQMVLELFEMGWEINKVSKTKGVMYWITDLKQYKIHVVKNHLYQQFKTEQENYVYKEVQGIMINQPCDKFNHFWDACFVGDTIISCKDGNKEIRDIMTGDVVLTSNGYRKVVNKFDNGLKKVHAYSLQFDTFSLSIRCTSDHKIKTSDGWIKVSELKPSTIVYTQKQNAVAPCVLVEIDSSPDGIDYVFDFEVEEMHEYFANGVLVHNCRYARMAHAQPVITSTQN